MGVLAGKLGRFAVDRILIEAIGGMGVVGDVGTSGWCLEGVLGVVGDVGTSGWCLEGVEIHILLYWLSLMTVWREELGHMMRHYGIEKFC